MDFFEAPLQINANVNSFVLVAIELLVFLFTFR